MDLDDLCQGAKSMATLVAELQETSTRLKELEARARALEAQVATQAPPAPSPLPPPPPAPPATQPGAPDYLPYTITRGTRQVRDAVLDTIWSGDDPMQYAERRLVDPGYPHTHIIVPAVNWLLRAKKPLFWMEAGSMIGGSALKTAQAIKDLGLSTSMLCMDPFTGDVNMWAWEAGAFKQGAWRFLRLEAGAPTIYDRFRANVVNAGLGDVIIPVVTTSLVGMKLLARLKQEGRLPQLPEVIYLDSAHEEGETYMELVQAWSLLPSGGAIWGDDFNWPGVGLDVVKFSKSGVAVDDAQYSAGLEALGSPWHRDGNLLLVTEGDTTTWMMFKA